MKSIKSKLIIALTVIIVLGVYYYVTLPAINIHSTETWIFLSQRKHIGGEGLV